MAKTIHFSSLPRFLPSTSNPLHIPPDISILCQNLSTTPTFKTLSLPRNFLGFYFSGKIHVVGEKIKVLDAWSGDGSLQELDDSPVSIELVPICSESQFDRVIAEAQQLEEPVIIIWMASWCRKCIYLKPKLEKLAADYYPRLRFYCIDVNNVPHKLVAYAGVTKMPTVQLWKDGKKQSEVIGGHKAHFVINEVREIIENEGTI
ncbi:thioredoxin-like 3-2, chloroplastic [Ricinus communis]|uniref:thioredoxin-like 3-2, chloroplastic n=1 Tax=Ricinus communis TaxID=3988 RepID=UPI0007727130|nr:thioredoxin-like 3-2, chloroplastic [Ricinus communis]|eukprot:XP_015581933.1 thioredoxin-like 3-2, chloroplastic [Ricinus communis]